MTDVEYLAALMNEHSWDGYHEAHGVMCMCGWRSFDGDPGIQLYDAYARHIAEVAIAAGYERRRDVAEAVELRKQVRG